MNSQTLSAKKWTNGSKRARRKPKRRTRRRKGATKRNATIDGTTNVRRNTLHSPNSVHRVRIAVTELVAMKNAYQILDYTPLTLGILKKEIDFTIKI
jgi:hypothetical protein